MRPIDADALYTLANNQIDESCYTCERNMSCFDCVLRRTPTLDVAPVVHAHFTDHNLYSGTMYECSNCKYLNIFAGAYCTNCGAKMD